MYREPSTYLTLENNPKYNTGVTPALIPVVVGEGPSKLIKTVALVRAATTFDVLPAENVSEIFAVGNLKNSEDYTKTTDYQLTAPNQITWLSGVDVKGPEVGQTYYVTFSYIPSEEYYAPYLVSTKDEVTEKYGPDVDETGKINPLSLGAELALESGANLVYVLPVKAADGGAITALNYEDAYNKHLRFLPDAYRVIPMNLQADINLKTVNHVDIMSTEEEKSERVTIIGADHTASDAGAVVQEVGGYAESLVNKRVAVIYPDKATRMLSDGEVYELGAPFICAALAGWKSAQPPQRAYTKGQLNNFIELKGVKLTRASANLLAAKGVMILEQPRGAGTPIQVRHGLTTDMSNVQTREISVVEIGDYCAKYIRNGLSSYIGKYNITPDLIVRLKASAKALLSVLQKEKVIIDGTISELFQDEYNPDTVILKIIVQVPYPCNYIEITLFLD